jgi:hypothetical protein
LGISHGILATTDFRALQNMNFNLTTCFVIEQWAKKDYPDLKSFTSKDFHKYAIGGG